MIIEYTPTLSDLLHAARENEKRQWRVANRIVSVSLIILGIIFFVWNSILFSIIFMCLGILELFNLIPSSCIRAIFEYHSNPKFKEKYQLELTLENLKFKTPTIDSTIKWTLYNKYYETSKTFILKYGKGMHTIIPKRVLSDQEQIELRDLLNKTIGIK